MYKLALYFGLYKIKTTRTLKLLFNNLPDNLKRIVTIAIYFVRTFSNSKSTAHRLFPRDGRQFHCGSFDGLALSGRFALYMSLLFQLLAIA